MPTRKELLLSRQSSNGGGDHGGDGLAIPPTIAADGTELSETNSFLDDADDEGGARNVSPATASRAKGMAKGRRVGGPMRSSPPLGLAQLGGGSLGGLGVVSLGSGGGRKRRAVPGAASGSASASASVSAASKPAAAAAATAARRTSLLSAEARLRRIGISAGASGSAVGMYSGGMTSGNGMASGTSGGAIDMSGILASSSPLAAATAYGYGCGYGGEGEGEGKEAHDHDGSAGSGGRITSIGGGRWLVGVDDNSAYRTGSNHMTTMGEDMPIGGNMTMGENETMGTTKVAMEMVGDARTSATAGKPGTTKKSSVQNVPTSTNKTRSSCNIDNSGGGNVGGSPPKIPPPSLVSPTVPAGTVTSPSLAKRTNEPPSKSSQSVVVLPSAESSSNNKVNTDPNVHAIAASATKIHKSSSSGSNRSSSMDRMAALIDVLERSGRLVPMEVEGYGEEGEEGEYGATTTAVTPKVGTATSKADPITHTPSDGRGLAYVSAHSSSGDASSGCGSSPYSSTYPCGNLAVYAPPLESYQHLLLDRFLPPLDVTTPNLTTTTTTGAWPTDRTDPFSVGDAAASSDGGSKKRARGGRGRRTKKVARKRLGRGKSGDDVGSFSTFVPAQATTNTTTGRGKSRGPARNDGRPPSLTAYLAGLNEAKLKKAEVKRKALEREEEYGLAAAAAANANAEEGTVEVNDEMNDDVFSFDAHDAALKGRGAGGYPKTLATDNDADNLAPKHCFGRKWLYELVCEPTGAAKTAAGGSSTALADLSSKENAGPAKKKRRRVFTAAPKTSSSVVGGGTAKVTATTIGKDAVDHRVCIRCRHCRDDKDCLRPSSLSETHFYNLLVFWANNHYERCEAVPAAIQAKYDEAKAIKARGRKSYWISEAHAIGLRDIVDKDGKIGQGVAFAPAARGSE